MSVSDKREGYEAPASNLFSITPSDATDFTNSTRAIYVGTGGDLVVLADYDSTEVTFSSVPGGTVLAVRAKRVFSTGTTATNLVGMY